MFDMKERVKRIKSLIEHRKAFRITERRVLGKNTTRAITHDLDKLVLYLFLFPIPWVRKRHKLKARHHQAKTRKDFIEKIIDFECARFTKKNSPLTAREYITSKDFKNRTISREDLLVILTEIGL